MPIKPVTVTQLSNYLKQIFDAEELLFNISVVGEVSGYSNVRGTAYFSLKDENSILSCVCFTADDFKDIKNGDSVVVVGTPRYYVKGGKLNFNVIKIEHYGESALYQKFLELKTKLENKGYFDQSHKKPMPKNIKRIGVVSSEGGAVIQDIINIRTRRNPKIDIVLYPVKVQGNNAEFEIAEGIKALDNYDVDVIVVARGGGSMEDLQPFNTEIVAEATYNCNKFIMSAVGHETDFTIIDFCSDLRAPTPSVAAELLCEDFFDKKLRFEKSVDSLLKSYNAKFNYEVYKYKNDVNQLLKSYQYLEQDSKQLFNKNLCNMFNLSKTYFDKREKELIYNNCILKKLDPKEVLKLGYASIKNLKGYVTKVSDLKKDDKIDIIFKDGMVKAKIL